MNDRHYPYGRHLIDEDDIQSVVDVLRSDFLTTGPAVERFESAVAEFTGARYAVAVNSGTAALHCAAHAMGLGRDDEVVVPPLTFAATANAACYCGARPVFADVEPGSLLLDPDKVQRALTPRTKAVFAVDYAGLPCDYERLRSITEGAGAFLLADACHSLGGEHKGRPVGTLADATVLSFHPVKHITTGEGGMLLTDDETLYRRARRFRNHGIDLDSGQRVSKAVHAYDMVDLGMNYRLTDIQCALGTSQLTKLPRFLERRRAIAAFYDEFFAPSAHVQPLATGPGHAYHLYVVRLTGPHRPIRDQVFDLLRERGVMVNVHYPPLHLHSYYRKTFGTGPGLCPVAEEAYQEILSLPIHQGLSLQDAQYVAETVREAVNVAVQG